MKLYSYCGKLMSVMLLVMTGYIASSCSDKEETLVPQVALNDSIVNLNKLGVGDDGDEAEVEVTSNVYWKLNKAEGDEWLTVSPMGGSGVTQVSLKALKNEGEARTARLVLETLDGQQKTITVYQSASDEIIHFVATDFGTQSVSEKTPLKLYTQWNLTGVGMMGTEISGQGTFVEAQSPSQGYPGASGGNNLQLDSVSFLELGPVATKGNTSFSLTFGMQADSDSLTLEVSNDDTNWITLPYQRKFANGWTQASVDFSLLLPTSYLYFRYSKAKEGMCRIDDVLLTEGKGGIEVDFDALVDDDKPAGFVYFEDGFDWITADFGGGDYVGKAPLGEYPPTGPRWDKLPDDCKPIWNASGWSVSSGYFTYVALGYVQLGRTTSGGDIITPRMSSYISSYPSIPERAGIGFGKAVNVIVSFDAAVYQGAAGNQDSDNLIFEVLDAGTLANKVDTEVKIKVNSWNQWKRFSIPVFGATTDTRIRIKYGVASPGARNRIFIDNIMIVKAEKKQ